MLRNIALTASALAFCLLMFVYLQNAPERQPHTVSVSVPVAFTAAPPTPTASVQTAVQVTVAAVEPSPPPPTVTPAPVAMETQIARILEENNRGIDTPVRVSKLLDTITVRWALNDRADVVADADTQIRQALGVIGGEYRLINFEGTFGLIYPDGRRAEEVVLWVTYEDGREVSRKVAPVLTGE